MTQTTPQASRSFWRTLGNVLKVVLQLTLIAIFMGAIAVALYLAIPWLYRETIVPVQNNAAAIEDLDRRLGAVASQADEQSGDLQSRNAELEGEVVQLQETVAVQERLLATAAAELATVVPAAEALMETTDAQAADLASLERSLARAVQALEWQAEDLEAETERVAELERNLAALGTAVTDQVDGLSTRTDGLLSRIALLQAAQDVVRIQLLLAEENPGLAQGSLTYVIDHLMRAAALDPALQVDVTAWADRVSELEILIQERSFRVGPALESLWADIADRALPPLPATTDLVAPATLDAAGAAVTDTLTTTVTLTLTVTPTLTPLPTPTPYVTLTPTPTPEP